MRRCCVQKRVIGFNHWKPRLERLSHICQKFGSCKSVVHPRRFSAKKPQPSSVAALQKTFGDSLGKPLLAAKPGSAGSNRLNARMTAKQGPVCVGDPPPTFWGPAFVGPPWHGVRLPVHSPRKPFGHGGTARNRSFIEVDPKPVPGGQISRSHRQWISRNAFTWQKTKIRVSKKVANKTLKKWLKYNVFGGPRKATHLCPKKAAPENQGCFHFQPKKRVQKKRPGFCAHSCLVPQNAGIHCVS